MSRILLVEIGTQAAAPPVTPPAPRPPSAWVPSPRPTPGLLPPTGLAVTVSADAAVATWTRSAQPGAITVIEIAPEVAGNPGVWKELARTADASHIVALPAGPAWVRVYAWLNGVPSVATGGIRAVPRSTAAIEQSAADAQAAAFAADAKAAKEIIDRQAADAVLTAELAVARAQIGDIMQADVHDSAKAYPDGDLVQFGSPAKLYRALQDVPTGIAITDAAYWELIGNYASLGEAVSATAALSTATASELDAVAQTVTQHAARMPVGEGALATEARVAGVESAAASATTAVGNRVGLIEVRVPVGADMLANEARVVVSESASVDRDNANAAAIAQAKASIPGSGNLLKNASGDFGLAGWSLVNNVGAWTTGLNVAGPSWHPKGMNAFSMTRGGLSAGNLYSDFQQTVPANPNSRYIASVYAATHRGVARLDFQALNAAGTVLASGQHGINAGNGAAGNAGTDLSIQTRLVVPIDTPPGTASLWIRLLGGGSDVGVDPYIWFIRPMIEEVPSGRTTPSVWSAGGSETAGVTQSFIVNAGPGGAYAQATLLADVNGKLAYQRLTNNGTESSIDFQTDKFTVSNDSGQGLGIADGVLTVRANGYLTAIGGPFGVNNEFVKWYGPDVALAACGRNNALSFETKDGLPYFGGVLTKSAITTTGTSAAYGNTTATATSFTTAGKLKKISASCTRSADGWMAGNQTGNIGNAFSVAFTLQRKLGAGNWTTIYSKTEATTVMGTAAYEAERGSTRVNVSASVGVAYDDADTTSGSVQYQVIVAITGGVLPTVSASQSGTPMNVAPTQSTVVRTSEEGAF